MPGSELTPEERRLELVLRAFAALFVLMAASYLVQGLANDEVEFPFVANSVAKDGVFAALAFAAGTDVRRNGWAGQVVIAGHLLIALSLVLMLAWGGTSSVEHTFGPLPVDVGAETLLIAWLAVATAVAVVLALLYHSAGRARYELRYLWPHQHRTAMAMAEVLVVGDDEVLSPEQVAKGIDDYLFSFTAKNKKQSKAALSFLTVYPLFRRRPPFALMSPERRLELLERGFHRDVVERRLPGPLRDLTQKTLCAAQQLAIIGYYADPRTAESVGYVPFSRRPRYAKAIAKRPPKRRELRVREPADVDAERIAADVVIVGSGAAGSILAHRLAERGREVVVIEGGKHVDPRDFTEDERVQFSNLFADGGLQMSTDMRFQVLQGKCVGGSTVINNAVCFDLPPDTLSRWNDPEGLDAGLDEERLWGSFARLREWLPAIPQDGKHGAPLQAGGTKMAAGIAALGLDGEGGVVDANIKDCLGSGYCNIGCAWGRKLSALDTTLPKAQKKFGADAVRIYSECLAERIATSGGRATEVRCRLSDGRAVTFSADTVVVAGGALASSVLLQRSGLGGRLAGTGLSFNVGAALTADFEERLDSYDGLQITHSYRPPGDERLILESWFNPVGTQALMMPGWFRDHYENMRRYAHLGSIGVVVGSQSNGRVRARRGWGMKLDYAPTEGDLKLLLKGTKLAARIHFAAGAMRVMPMTFRSLSYTEAAQLDELDVVVRDNTDISLHTSHPMGGNAVSRDPAKGVVDERFKVHGTENVYVCDASVFPGAVTVNPQLTVMALADYASAEIA